LKKNKPLLCFSALLLLLGTFACRTNTEQAKGKPQEQAFFSLANFLDGEKARLQRKNVSFEKTTTFDGKTETKIIPFDSLDWAVELAAFYDSDINKPSIKHKYSVDSIYLNKMLVGLKYQTKSPDVRTRELDVFLEDDQVVSCIIKNSTDNAVYKASQQLEYDTDEGYSIENQQKLPFSDANKMSVAVKFR
jgi:hypothetical protein